jgi:hypothetical protein
MPICGAKTRAGTPCQQTIICQNGRCRMHGGTSLRGLASPRYKHGRYSKYLPQRMLPRYLESRDDPDLLNLRWEVGLVDARIADLMARVDTGEAGATWARLDGLRQRFEQARAEGRTAAQAVAIQSMMDLVRDGVQDFAIWDDIVNLVERRRRLVESERKRMIEMHHLVQVDKTLVMVNQLARSVREHVLANCDGDAARTILAGVQADITTAIGAESS